MEQTSVISFKAAKLAPTICIFAVITACGGSDSSKQDELKSGSAIGLTLEEAQDELLLSTYGTKIDLPPTQTVLDTSEIAHDINCNIGIYDTPNAMRVCINYGTKEANSITETKIRRNDSGIDYVIELNGDSNFGAVQDVLSSRYGTAVISLSNSAPYTVMLSGYTKSIMGVKNVETPNIITCQHEVALIEIEIGEVKLEGMTNYSIKPYLSSYTLSEEYFDENGDYNITGINCSFYSPNESSEITFENAFTLQGNVCEDIKNNPNMSTNTGDDRFNFCEE